MKKHFKKWFYGYGILLLCLVSMLCLANCTTTDSKDNVVEELKKECLEDFELVCTETIKERPEHIRYTFETTERNLVFTADSMIIQKGIEQEHIIECHYTEAVCRWYNDRIRKELRLSPNFREDLPDSGENATRPFKGNFIISSFADIEEAAKILEKCNQIYAEELQYNSKEFMKDHPAGIIQLLWFSSAKDARNISKGTFISLGHVTGCKTYKKILFTLGRKYTQLCKDHVIPITSDIPQTFLDEIHASNLKITLNNEKVDSDVYGYCQYNYKQGSYMVNIYSAKSKLLLSDYMEKTGINYTQSSDGTTLQWKTGTDIWILNNNRYNSFLAGNASITKNGKQIPIAIDSDGYYTCANVPLKDFADMLNLEYTVNEDDVTVSFTSINTK